MGKDRLLRGNGWWIEKLKKLLLHHFIYKQQENFLKNKKETLSDNECVWPFISIQSFHWSNTKATIHPFIYYKQNGTLKHKSLACISDVLQQDVHTVYTFQKTIILNVVKQDLPQIKKVIYFSDGCSGQYKNHKCFTNLFYHYCNYLLYAEWHFCTISHGKNACDGIGVTIKCMAAYASLQRSVTGQIFSPKSLFKLANSEIPGMQLFWVPTTEIIENKHLLEKRLEISSTLPGSRCNHFF